VHAGALRTPAPDRWGRAGIMTWGWSKGSF
jgi:hypothetical protein